MKKTAVKALIILIGIALVCVFFSGTLHSITTAKVQMTKAKTGKLTSEISMNGELYWPETESIFVPGLTSEDTLVIRRMPVSTGSWVQAGQVIAECDVSEADSRLSTLQSQYKEKENEYLDLERKNQQFQMSSQQKAWYDAWQALKDARQAEQAAAQELKMAAWKAGISLEADGSLPPETTDEAALAAWDVLDGRRQETEQARALFDRYNLFPVSEEVTSYLDKRTELEEEMAGLENQMLQLRILKESAASITAPHDGYITSAELKAGDSLSLGTVLVQMTTKGSTPVIRLDPDANRKVIADGTEAELSAGEKTITAAVSGITFSPEGKSCIDVPVSRDNISSLGGVTALTEPGSVTATVRWQSETATTLIPTAAIRGSEGDYYIYVVQADFSGAAGNQPAFQKISRKNVTVLGQSGSVTSVSDSLGADSIVYMEDRPLSDGCEVMPYSEK